MSTSIVSINSSCLPGFRRLSGSERILFHGSLWHWHRWPHRPSEHRPSDDAEWRKYQFYHLLLSVVLLLLILFHLLNFVMVQNTVKYIHFRYLRQRSSYSDSKWTPCLPTGSSCSSAPWSWSGTCSSTPRWRCSLSRPPSAASTGAWTSSSQWRPPRSSGRKSWWWSSGTSSSSAGSGPWSDRPWPVRPRRTDPHCRLPLQWGSLPLQ